MRLATISSLALAALLLLGTGRAAPAARFQADVPLLDVYPGSTVPGKTAATETDIYMPAGTQMAKVVLYIPTGYGNVVGRAPNTQVGQFLIWNQSFLYDFGYITADDPAAYTTDPCAPGVHQAVWLLRLEIEPGDLPATPVFVDATTGSDTALGGYKAQLCIPAASAKKIRELDLNITKLVNPATAGIYRWRAFVTPYQNGTANAAGTFELRATVPMPSKLTLHGRYDRKHKRAILTGRLTATGYGVKGVYVDLYANGHSVGYARVNSRGAFSLKRKIKKTTRYRVVTANYTDCDPGTRAPAGCLSDTLVDISSPLVKVVVRKHK